MSSRTTNVDLLLLENVESLGIVGDIVTVKAGYARNYLLPRGVATSPSQDLIDQLSEKRKAAQAEVARLRAEREKMIGELEGFNLTIVKSCNDQGLLYGSVTQQDIADLLGELEHPVRPRDVRLGQTIKRVGEYDILVKPEQDLEATVHLVVEPEGGPLEVDEEPEQQGEADAGDGGDSGDGVDGGGVDAVAGEPESAVG